MKNALAACLAGLFPFRIALSSFLLLLEVGIHLLRDIFNFLLAVFIFVHWEAGSEVLLPGYPCLIFRLMGFVVVGFWSTHCMVFTPMVCAKGHAGCWWLVCKSGFFVLIPLKTVQEWGVLLALYSSCKLIPQLSLHSLKSTMMKYVLSILLSNCRMLCCLLSNSSPVGLSHFQVGSGSSSCILFIPQKLDLRGHVNTLSAGYGAHMTLWICHIGCPALCRPLIGSWGAAVLLYVWRCTCSAKSQWHWTPQVQLRQSQAREGIDPLA